MTIILIVLQPVTDISCWLEIQDLYPDHEVDAELSDEDNIGQNKPTGDDARGDGAPSVKTLAPNPIRSKLAEESCPSATDRTTSTTPLGGGQKKKHVVLGTKRNNTKLRPIR
jgi:hypothetical protein